MVCGWWQWKEKLLVGHLLGMWLKSKQCCDLLIKGTISSINISLIMLIMSHLIYMSYQLYCGLLLYCCFMTKQLWINGYLFSCFVFVNPIQNKTPFDTKSVRYSGSDHLPFFSFTWEEHLSKWNVCLMNQIKIIKIIMSCAHESIQNTNRLLQIIWQMYMTICTHIVLFISVIYMFLITKSGLIRELKSLVQRGTMNGLVL